MQLIEIARSILLILLIVCAIGVNFGKSLLQAVIIFMSYSSIMCILWVLLESPDLAITEAAVGAGVSSVLFMLTLRRIRTEDLRLEALETEARLAESAKRKEMAQAGKTVKAASAAAEETQMAAEETRMAAEEAAGRPAGQAGESRE